MKDPEHIAVYIGQTDVAPPLKSKFLFFAERFIRHEKYRSNMSLYGVANDIALIKLNRKIDFEGNYKGECQLYATFLQLIFTILLKDTRCACSPESMENLDLSQCVAMGWGMTKNDDMTSLSSKLLDLRINVLPDEKCIISHHYKPETMLCTGIPGGGVGGCHGDSGKLVAIGISIL